MNQIWLIGTEIWFRTDKTCGRTNGQNGQTHGRRQNYIPLTSSGDNKICATDFGSIHQTALIGKDRVIISANPVRDT